MPLSTHCAQCGREFPVYAQQLKARRGRVECPHCDATMNAVAALVDEPGFAGEPVSGRGGAGRPRRGTAPPAARPSLIPAAAPTPVRVPTTPAPSAPAGRAAGARLAWGLASLVLMVVLGVQLTWWRRADLLRDPQGFKALSALCGYLGCELPLARLPGALGVLEPTLAPDEASGALVLHLHIANRAARPQPAPLIELELFDQQGELAAARRFSPGEYAPAGAAPIAPGETRVVALAMAPPREEASGFRVRLQ